MKRHLRIGAVLLSLTMALSLAQVNVFAASATNTKTETGIKFPLEKKITVTYWDRMPTAAPAVIKSYNDSELYKELEKRTNIHIEWIHPNEATRTEQFFLMLASKKIPDILGGECLNDYSGKENGAFNDGLIADLKPLLNYAPNFSKIITTYPGTSQYIENMNGNILAFNFMRGDDMLCTYNGPIMRADWLNELGLKVPKTIDDWYTTLKAFKEKKGAKAPLTGTLLSIVGNGGSAALAGAYGITFGRGNVTGLFLENNKVTYGPTDPRAKEFVKTLQKWYKEGLLDPDFVTNATRNLDANMTNGASGAIVANVGGNMGNWLTTMTKIDPNYTLNGVPYPVANDVKVNTFVQRDTPVSVSGPSVYAKSKYIKEIVALLDYGYSKEGMFLYNFGVDGISYTMENGQPKYKDVVTNNPTQPFSTIANKYIRGHYSGPFIQDVRYFNQYITDPRQISAIKRWTQNISESVEANNGLRSDLLNEAESRKLAPLQTAINTYRDEQFLKWVVNQADVESTWGAYLEQMNKMGIEQIIKSNQDAYDRYIAKFPDKPTSFRLGDIYK